MKIVLIGCVQWSAAALEAVIAAPQAQVVGVVTRKKSTFNSDFVSLAPRARRAGIPFFYADEHNAAALETWVRDRDADVIYCLGWSELLRRRLIESARLGTVGHHPAALPKNRGRHPIIWALALGLKSTASTFFWMDEGADSGDILSQKKISISPVDDAGTLYRKVIRAGVAQIRTITRDLAAGRVRRIRQNVRAANTWRKRGESDGRIDWRMSAGGIHNLVRALAKPYGGADCFYRGKRVIVWKTQVVRKAPANLEPGKVLGSGHGFFTVKCGDGALKVLKHECKALPKKGEYL